ncbi:oligosaccharide flippase family protein [Rheinheimera texasensis]|uniref:oligosaccharide flippase family protein n=1 Tax=Rheinheimera texasensis TaxID=306205 RepID=UPI0004E14A73|nr:oligosaccharide flippase family protein [Rheinheimera texasensis]
MTIKDLRNIFWLAVNQGGNALFPLVLMPWLLLALGSEDFARLVLAEVIAFYVLTLCLYSFDVTQVKAVATAVASSDDKAQAQIFYQVLQTRLLLFVLCSLVLLGVTYNLALEPFFLIWLLFPLGMILQHNYFFQACQENKALALLVFISRLLVMGAVWWLQNQQQLNVETASWLAAGSYLLSGLLASLLLMVRLPRNGWPAMADSVQLIRDGSVIFTGNLAVTLYRNTNVFLLSLLATPYAVSVYAIAEKYVRMLQALARPLNDHYYAKIASLLNPAALNASFAVIRQSTRPQLLLLLVAGGLGALAAFVLAGLGLLPSQFLSVLSLLAIMSGAVLFGVVNFMYGVVGLNNLGYDRAMARRLLLVGVISLLLCALLAPIGQQYGAALAFVFAEMLLTILIVIKIRQVTRA